MVSTLVHGVGRDLPVRRDHPHALQTRFGYAGLKGFKGSHGVNIGHLKSLEERLAALPSHAPYAADPLSEVEAGLHPSEPGVLQRTTTLGSPRGFQDSEVPVQPAELEWNVKGGKRNIWDYVIQFRASGVRVKRRTTAPSLIAMTDTQVPIIGWQKRYMTPHECARLQSLDGLRKLTTARRRRSQHSATQ